MVEAVSGSDRQKIDRGGPPRARRLRSAVALIASGLVFGSLLSGCSPLYVLQAAYEEGKILWRREPIADYLARPDVSPEIREKLRMVLDVRDYAANTLKMNVGGSYSTYSYVDRPDLSYLLTAAPRTSLQPYTWWFLLVGRVPYKGYFSRADADHAAADLQKRGYDTYIRSSAAFSTLGYFNDPLLSHLLRYDKTMLAELIFHELLHNTLYVKGASDFNESLANFVGSRAAIQFFREKYGPGSTEHKLAIRSWQDDLEFSAFIQRCAASLDDLYRENLPFEEKLRLRDELFQKFKEEWARELSERPNRFRRFSQQPLNNAIIIHYLLYYKDLKLFETLYDMNGQDLLATIERVRAAVKEGGSPFERVEALVGNQKRAAS
jgi:predicted aminopeptidase